jgi:dephospho-CoA kinase
MLKAGITGGIGSGKTSVCKVFETLGIPVFYADEAARKLQEEDPILIAGIKKMFGEAAYQNGRLDRAYVGNIVFNDPVQLQQLNALTHPATIRYAQVWTAHQHSPYVIKEAALFFETGSNQTMDVLIGVTAPQEIRIRRTMQRDSISREQVLQRMYRQMDEQKKMSLCDHVILNDDITPVIPQVLTLHEKLLQYKRKI